MFSFRSSSHKTIKQIVAVLVNIISDGQQFKRHLFVTLSPLAQASSHLLLSIHLSPPRMVPSPSEKGGSSVGPASPSRKENYATETCTTNENNTSVLEEAGPGVPGRMTCCGESRKETTMPMTLLSTRKTFNIGTWNVRTMYKAGKTATVTAEMRRFNLAVVGLCETRWTQSGQLLLTTGELILYSGHGVFLDAPHSEGVAQVIHVSGLSLSPAANNSSHGASFLTLSLSSSSTARNGRGPV